MNRKKLKTIGKKLITAENIKIIILFVPMLILLIFEVKSGEFQLENYLDTGVFVSVAFVMICNTIAYILERFIGKHCEDAVKLTTDYSALIKKYSREKLLVERGQIFPVIELAGRNIEGPPFYIEINGCNAHKHYQLPSQVAKQSDYLFKAHEYSIVYNNMNIRLDDIEVRGLDVELIYSNTTYYDSLITNRAMDYVWENGKSIREIYEPGPFLSTLEESKLSNHLGFNGFVELSDGKIIFVMRSGNLSIGKRTLASSVAASLKVKYCFDDQKRFTLQGLGDAIRCEVLDELKIELNENENLVNSIFSFYRDVLEGGKPQFLFYIKLENMTVDEFETNFKKKIKKNKQQDLKKAVVDGTHFQYFTIEELEQSTITSGKLIASGKREFDMMPSASASIALLLKYLKGEGKR